MAAADGPSAADDEGPTEVRSVREVSANSDRLVLGGGGGGGRPFSAVSKPNFASKYAFESSRRDLHNTLLCTDLKSHFFKC